MQTEYRASIAGMDYGPSDIVDEPSVEGVLRESALEAGGVFAGRLTLTVVQKGNIPRMAQIRLWSRGTGGEWAPSGVFYIDTRAEDGEIVTLDCYDDMLKADDEWWDPSEDAGEWPMPQTAAAADIARRMGVALDPRTWVDPSLMTEYPNDLTMREVLAYIAASNCGNWSMSGDGRLLLTPQAILPKETSLLVDGEDGGAILFGSVRIIV